MSIAATTSWVSGSLQPAVDVYSGPRKTRLPRASDSSNEAVNRNREGRYGLRQTNIPDSCPSNHRRLTRPAGAREKQCRAANGRRFSWILVPWTRGAIVQGARFIKALQHHISLDVSTLDRWPRTRNRTQAAHSGFQERAGSKNNVFLDGADVTTRFAPGDVAQAASWLADHCRGRPFWCGAAAGGRGRPAW